jgi:hypothetical protein
MANEVGRSYWRCVEEMVKRTQHIGKILTKLMCPECLNFGLLGAKGIFLLKGTIGP